MLPLVIILFVEIHEMPRPVIYPIRYFLHIPIYFVGRKLGAQKKKRPIVNSLVFRANQKSDDCFAFVAFLQ